MALFRQEVLEELTRLLQHLGVGGCATCGATKDWLATDRKPVVLNVGGLTKNSGPDANIIFMLGVKCRQCGNLRLFDVETFHRSDEPIFER